MGKVERTEEEFFRKKRIEKQKEKRIYNNIKNAVLEALAEFHKND